MGNLRILAFIAVLMLTNQAFAAKVKSVSKTDNRIKTLVYNESEVYQVIARTGFQSQIEFAANEVIETISIGDTIGWQITPANNRIFVKPLHKTGITNLSVITNKRGYQFELVSTDSSSRNSNHAYLLKFYYPELDYLAMAPIDRTRNQLRPVSDTPIPEIPTPITVPDQLSIYNFNYTLTGPDSISPQKIYDDGRSTYFELSNGAEEPSVSVENADGTQEVVNSRIQNAAYSKIVVVDRLAPKFFLNIGSQRVIVYNEQMLSSTIGAR